jgi:hypothetical protein
VNSTQTSAPTAKQVSYAQSLFAARVHNYDPAHASTEYLTSLSMKQVSLYIAALVGRPVKVAVAKAAPAVEVEVPQGRYALVSDGEVKFYQVQRPTEGQWTGRTFVKIQASDDTYPVVGAAATKVLSRIAADVKDASTRYGQEIGSCGVCGRTLTDEASRAYGVGPVCRSKMGW